MSIYLKYAKMRILGGTDGLARLPLYGRPGQSTSFVGFPATRLSTSSRWLPVGTDPLTWRTLVALAYGGRLVERVVHLAHARLRRARVRCLERSFVFTFAWRSPSAVYHDVLRFTIQLKWPYATDTKK